MNSNWTKNNPLTYISTGNKNRTGLKRENLQKKALGQK